MRERERGREGEREGGRKRERGREGKREREGGIYYARMHTDIGVYTPHPFLPLCVYIHKLFVCIYTLSTLVTFPALVSPFPF